MEEAFKGAEAAILQTGEGEMDMFQMCLKRDTFASVAKRKVITFMIVQKTMTKTTILATRKVSLCLKFGDGRPIVRKSLSKGWTKLWNLWSKI